jgi:hypothetical protein
VARHVNGLPGGLRGLAVCVCGLARWPDQVDKSRNAMARFLGQVDRSRK